MSKKHFMLFFLAAALELLAAGSLPAPWQGSVTLAGNGKFACREDVLPLAPGNAYLLSFGIRKNAPLSENPIEHRLVLYAIAEDGKHQEIATFADEVPVDDAPHHVRAAFRIDEGQKGKYKLFVYNCNADGSLILSDITLTDLGPLPAAAIGSTPATDAAAIPEAVQEDSAPASCIRPRMGNTRLTKLEGNGRFLYEKETIPAEPGARYDVSFEMRKTGELSPNPIEHRMVLAVEKTAGGGIEFMYAGEDVPVDGEWHTVTNTCTIPTEPGKVTIFVYNVNGEGSLEIRDLKLTLQNAETSAPEPEPAAAPAADSALIRPRLGNEQTACLEGNGRFLYVKETIPAEPGARYDVTFEMRKTGELSPNPIEHRMVLAVEKTAGGILEFMYAGEDVPADGEWHTVTNTCTIPTDPGKVTLFVYNVNSDGNLELRNLQLKKNTPEK